MSMCNPSATPIEAKMKLTKEDSGSFVDPTEYRSIVGSLRYLVNIRPNIAYVVGVVSRYMEKLTDQHKAEVKQILRKSTGGCVFLLEGNMITWNSQKQEIVALSSCEAKYMVAAMAACQGIWLLWLIADLLGKNHGLKVNNMSTIELSQNHVHHG
ncbi:secreted RxLR effector protein 161-like [Phragmites australis]|uniref:secreted RxLR effector protein 161-like n=1 Tax=Phragmites australis TaxID=29695 RepID=UPI002D77DE0B|nr:secreted RxLR effector protein 161-like [Phragmites australis]